MDIEDRSACFVTFSEVRKESDSPVEGQTLLLIIYMIMAVKHSHFIRLPIALTYAIKLLPRVCIRGMSTWTRENLIQTLQHGFIQRTSRLECGFELLQRARSDNRRGDCRIACTQARATLSCGSPSSRHSAANSSSCVVLLDPFGVPSAACSFHFLERIASQQSTVQRAPWNDAEAEIFGRGQYFQLRQTTVEAVFMLFGNQAQEMAVLGLLWATAISQPAKLLDPT